MAKNTNATRRRPGRPAGQTLDKATYQVEDIQKLSPDARFPVKVELTPKQMADLGIKQFTVSANVMARAIAKALRGN